MLASTALAAKIATAAILTSGAVVATAAVAAPPAPSESTVKAAPQAAPRPATIHTVVWVDWLSPRYADTFDINCPDKPGLKDFCEQLDTRPKCPGSPLLYCNEMARVNGRYVYVNQHVPPSTTDEARVVLTRWRGWYYNSGGTAKYPMTSADTNATGTSAQKCSANHGIENCDFVYDRQYTFTTYPATMAGQRQCLLDGDLIVAQPDGTEKIISGVVRDGWEWSGCIELHQPTWMGYGNGPNQTRP